MRQCQNEKLSFLTLGMWAFFLYFAPFLHSILPLWHTYHLIDNFSEQNKSRAVTLQILVLIALTFLFVEAFGKLLIFKLRFGNYSKKALGKQTKDILSTLQFLELNGMPPISYKISST